MAAKAPVGVVGLGLMGTAISARLLAAGEAVVGYDLETTRGEDLATRGGVTAANVAAVGSASGIVVLSLPDGVVSSAVAVGEDGLLGAMAPGGLVIDTTTSRPDQAQEIGAELAGRGIGFVDAGLSGSSTMAAAGDLVAMVGGSNEDYRRAAPVLATFTRSIHHVGDVGAGMAAKLAVNLVLGVNRVAIAEALVLGQRSGLDPTQLMEVMRDGAAYSRAMDIAGPRMIAGDHYPPASRLRQSHKDFLLILGQAQRLGAATPLASAVEVLQQSGEEAGLSDADNSVVVEIIRRVSGDVADDDSGSDDANAGDHGSDH